MNKSNCQGQKFVGMYTFFSHFLGHNAAICALESDEDRMVSSDDLGNIIVWEAGDKFRQLLNIKGAG